MLGYEATVKELDNNLLGMGAVKMLKPSELNKTIQYEALNYLTFLNRKRCGKIKARGCANGRPQREYISKDESSSPTVLIYALMTSCLTAFKLLPHIWGRKRGPFLTGLYLPQKSVLSPHIESQNISVQRHVSSY
jgi:hypothetical protein